MIVDRKSPRRADNFLEGFAFFLPRRNAIVNDECYLTVA
jgi:hypothetical protein